MRTFSFHTFATRLWEIQVRPDDASQFLSPESELAPYPGAQEAKAPGHGCVSDGEQYNCDLCGKPSKRLQEHKRHIREVHGLVHQCPLCPYRWKRPYKIKDHLIRVHKKGLIRVVEGIRILRGKNVVKFVETLKFLQNFGTPETNAPSPFLAMKASVLEREH